MPPPQRSYSTAALLLCAASAAADVVLDGGAGLTWRVMFGEPGGPYALGQPSLRGAPLDAQPVADGIAFFRRASDALVVPVLGAALAVDARKTSAVLRGGAQLPGGSSVDVNVSVALHAADAAGGAPAATLSVAFSASAALTGWALILKWCGDGPTGDGWRATGYPKAANSTQVQPTNLDYMGWPGFFLFRPNHTVTSFWSLSTTQSYNDPTSWTGSTTFRMQSGDATAYAAAAGVTGTQIAPQFAFGGGGMEAGVVYNATTRLLASDAGETLAAVRAIAPALLALDDFAVQPLAENRSAADMLACFVNARRVTPMWQQNPCGLKGSGYLLQDAPWYVDIYVSSTPASALIDYLVFEKTNDTFWRNRTMEQMYFWMGAVAALPPDSRHAGVMHTAFDVPTCAYNSVDRGNNRGFKLDLNGHSVRYALLLWEEVLRFEGANMSAWAEVARGAAQWLYRMGAAQAGGGAPGSAGFPQMIDAASDAPTPSVVSGRLMNALPVIARVLGDSAEANYTALREGADRWLAERGEADLFFTAQHPDLVWSNQDGDAIWALVEHWLDVHDQTGAQAALDRAVGDAYLALLMACPVQLPWVSHPTQLARDEQAGYSQYSACISHRRRCPPSTATC